jgi:thiamine-phosphate pyrophosphorylase
LTRLPSLLVLTDRRLPETRHRSLTATVAEAVAAGAPAIVFREKDLPVYERRRLGEQVAGVLGPRTRLIIASDAALAVALGASGVHLAASDPAHRGNGLLRGRSCHDAAELEAAASEGVDYATLSPVYETASKPDYRPVLGPGALRALAGQSGAPPVYALGGVDAGRVPECLAAGAAGVAVMGPVMAAADPAAAVAEILGAVDTHRKERVR